MIQKNLKNNFKNFKLSKPFNYAICDNFFNLIHAKKLAKEFPKYSDNDVWHEYKNPVEVKKSCNNWNKFSSHIYQTFLYLNSDEFIKKLEKLTKIKPLFPDFGLHGGGLHTHKNGGKLNHHLDYSLHPKSNLQRKINLIVYLSPRWKKEYGGELGFWSHDKIKNCPLKLEKKIVPIFNRAVIFDTTQNSWHGIVSKLKSKKKIYRNSIAIYYMTYPPKNIVKRERALYAPNSKQVNKKEIINFIKKRSISKYASKMYKTK